MNLTQINAELKALSLGITVEMRGGKLSLRAKLPPKFKSKKSVPYQQRISLGLPANPAGLIRARGEAIKLAGLLACNEFDWSLYIDEEGLTCEEWCARFKQDYFHRRADTAQVRNTYRSDYHQIFKKLPLHKPITEKILVDTLLSIKPDTRQRKRGTVALTQLAELAGIEVELGRYKGNYSHASRQRRKLPSDETLIKVAQSIPSGRWKNFVLVLITYGLRPHEGFYCDFSDSPILYVTNGKTGPRHVAPLRSEWGEEFDFEHAEFPPGGVAMKNKNWEALGARVSTQFRRYSIPFPTYVPRHAYAKRCKDFDVSPIDAAKLMGHSLQNHFKYYHHYYDKENVMQLAKQLGSKS